MNSKPLTKVQQTRYNLINGLRNDAIESIEKIKAKLDGRTFNAYKTKIMSSSSVSEKLRRNITCLEP